MRRALVLLAACGGPAANPADAMIDTPVDVSGPAAVSVSPASHDFGDFLVLSGDPRPTQTFVLHNQGTGPATIGPAVVVGDALDDFTVTSNDCPELLAADATCTVGVSFFATAKAARVAILRITTDTQVVTAVLGGRGLVRDQRVTVKPGARNFGDFAVGVTSPEFTFDILNESIAATSLTPTIIGPGAASFAIVSTDCTAGEIPVHGSCAVTIAYTPTFGGEFSADLRLADDQGGISTGGLYGTSSTPFAITPYAGFFGSVLIGQPDPGRQVTFTITNTSGVATGTIAANLVGPAAVDFKIFSTTCTTLAPDATCDVVVELAPLTRGAKRAELEVTDTATAIAVRSRLRGDGYTLFVVGTATFPDTAQAQTSATQSYKVLNASDVMTGAITTSLVGTNAGQFAIATDGCQAGIPPHMSCTIELAFSPTSAGLKTATLHVMASPGGSDNHAISGRGL